VASIPPGRTLLAEGVRIFVPLDAANTREIVRHSFSELDRFLNVAGTPPGKYSRYSRGLIGMCLVQGAAQHVVDVGGPNTFDNEVCIGQAEVHDKGFQVRPDGRVISGIKDIDVIFFFRDEECLPLPKNRHLRKSLVVNFRALGKRRLDFMKKGIPEGILTRAVSDHPRDIFRAYVEGTDHGCRYLSKKSLIGLYPEKIFCEPLWCTKRLTSLPGAPR
jgi:hypothetical protein